jgi:hypothetical protein
MFNNIEQANKLVNLVIDQYPEVIVDIDDNTTLPTSVWWIDFTFKDERRVTVSLESTKVTVSSWSPENRADIHYGMFSYGDEVYNTIEEAVARLFNLLKTNTYTVCPGWN